MTNTETYNEPERLPTANIITQGKKNVFLTHSVVSGRSKKLIYKTKRSDTGSVKEVECTQEQADVYIHQQVVKSLRTHPDDINLPHMSMLCLPKEYKAVRERDVLVRFRVPEASMSWIDNDILSVDSTTCFNSDSSFFPTSGTSNFTLAVLTIYPVDSGYFATLKTEQGYTGLPMSHWMSLVPIWRKTVVKTEIAILIDSEAQSDLPGLAKMANKRGYTFLGAISGFFNKVEGSFEALLSQLSACKLFADARVPAEPTMDDEFGFAFSMATNSVYRFDARRSILLTIIDFDSSTNTWVLGFTDTGERLTQIPYSYDDFFTMGYQIAVVASFREQELVKVFSYQFHSSCLDEESSSSQLETKI
ncbi:hypothetical protein AB4552_01730 [Vibrio sp. 10N.222.54.C3]|uniref:hypothetical protein n=1 Tax=unclassified Vibrio TaxID=2614977 RepID=UPI00354AFBD0